MCLVDFYEVRLPIMIATCTVVSAKVGVRGLVLSPTRELAIQTLKFCKMLGKHTDLRFTTILGGDSMDQQFSDMHVSHFTPFIVLCLPLCCVSCAEHGFKFASGFALT